MDFLEHVEEPELAIREAARLVAPDGLFIFHSFSRNWVAWLVVIKGVEWFVRTTPPHMHVLSLFIKPEDLVSMCARSGLSVDCLRGIAPVVFSKGFWTCFSTHRGRQLYLPLHTVHQDFLLRIRPQDPRP
jgi:2-polyprenyl-6-hydroxyphenyl methylase/3-demethylubiquinone-9 3-methyltransferase